MSPGLTEMNIPNPVSSNAIQWMLHSVEVSDAALAEALVIEYHADLQAFGLWLAEDPVEAGQIARQAIVEAVARRHRFFVDVGLKTWLYSLAYQAFGSKRYEKRSLLSRLRGALTSMKWEGQGKGGSGQVGESPPAGNGYLRGKDLVESLEREQALILLLFYAYGFSTLESGYVLGLDPDEARNHLSSARRALYEAAYPYSPLTFGHHRYIALFHGEEDGAPGEAKPELEQHLEACPECSQYVQRFTGLQARMLSELFTGEPASIGGGGETLADVLSRVGQTNRRSRLSLPLKETALVVVVLGLLYAFGRSQNVFEPFDARPTITPLPSSTSIPTRTPFPTMSPPSILLRGMEGVDYFYYDTETVDGDTYESIAGRARTPVNLVVYLNQALRGSFSGYRIRLAGLRSSGMFDPPPPTPASPTPAPLSKDSTVQEALKRVQENRNFWRTRWYDQITVFYGPAGYAGPPSDIYRSQTWESQPHNKIVARGDVGGSSSRVHYIAGDWVFSGDSGDSAMSADWLLEDPYREPASLDETSLPQGESYRIAGETTIAGRAAVGLDWEGRANQRQRFWVDAITGVVLGVEKYSGIEASILVELSLVNQILYDVEFPEDMFYPPLSPVKGLARNHLGEPLSEDPSALPFALDQLPYRPVFTQKAPAPDGFDPSRAPITLQWPGEPVPGSEIVPADEVDVYAGEYFLGSISLNNSIFRSCRRSPDGRFVALSVNESGPEYSSGALYWLDLETLDLIKTADERKGVVSFDFSPDSRRLAFFSCQSRCMITILDLESGESYVIPSLNGWNFYLEWSQDEDQIVYTTQMYPPGAQIHIVHVESGEEQVFNAEIDYANWTITAPGSPTEDWEPAYPKYWGYEGCMIP